ncbi:3-ketodihydrosphingosine reductase tsc-10 [Scedosporium apiospermum]|uniref:3-dehydrosphinganine reductase n=1 Tax=Pseudallescheria apiosperma TaxID=563466 RepID=A0A084G2N7_PSEDA|nr:3-ketodihydrosphingosine reductase tsc-10 [Scedosporium apiospermum]KEZ41599.1 3-ketodihydrosphingosine reductase tsc-10 [Scedosporium apiospermum]
MGLFSRNQMPVDGKTVLLTGASEGMGLEVAKQLAAKGANLILVSRSVGKLEEAILSLKAVAKHPETQRFLYISADVSAPDYAGPLIAEAIAWNAGRAPDIVWCIAGMCAPGLFVETPFSNVREHMDLNFYGMAEMSHAILREWLSPTAPVEQQPKHLVLTSSVVAFYTIAGYGGYAPAKSAIRALADTISQEVMLYPQKVAVHVVYPGSIDSPGLERENKLKPEITLLMEKDDPVQSAEEVASRAIAGLERGDFFITVSWLGHLMKWGVMGGSLRNNWVVDTLMQIVVAISWIIAQPVMLGTVRKFARENGHPSTYKKKNGA